MKVTITNDFEQKMERKEGNYRYGEDDFIDVCTLNDVITGWQ